MGIKWKDAAISELQDLPLAEKATENLPELIDRQDAIIRRIRTSDPGKAVGGGADGDALLDAIVYRDELCQRLEEARHTVAAIEGALSVLSGDEVHVLEQTVIGRRRDGAQQLCEEYGVEPNTVYRWRNAALERFCKALYGCK